MHEKRYDFSYKVYDNIYELPAEQQSLLQKAQQVSAQAYAPYSNFQVGAIAKLSNGEMVTATNQENASYPVGLCAERVLLAMVMMEKAC